MPLIGVDLLSPEIGFRRQAAIAAAGTDNSGLGERKRHLSLPRNRGAFLRRRRGSSPENLVLKTFTL
jgi:hypothetical protein